MEKFLVVEQYIGGKWVELAALEVAETTKTNEELITPFYKGLLDRETSYISIQYGDYAVRIATESGPIRATVQERQGA